MQTGRIASRSDVTIVAFKSQGEALPAAESTLSSLLKDAGYNTYFCGQEHLGEEDYPIPPAHSYE